MATKEEILKLKEGDTVLVDGNKKTFIYFIQLAKYTGGLPVIVLEENGKRNGYPIRFIEIPKEKPELYWIWKVKQVMGEDKGTIAQTGTYMNNDKIRTNGKPHPMPMELIEKIGTPITKDGKDYHE